jgi:glycosyltransferase involved in cell wall biosynthesis
VTARPFEVLQLGPYPPPNGGVQTNLVAIRRYLQAKGVPCRVINLTRYRLADHDGVFYPAGALSTLALLLRLPHDVIHLHIGGDLSPRLLLLGLICCLVPGTRTVLTFHSGGYPASPSGLAARPRSLAGFILRRFDRLIAVNSELAELFIRRFGASPDRVRRILPYALPGDVPAVQLPAAIEGFFATHSPVMISMGWLEPEYDFALQIRSLEAVKPALPRAGLLILGEGRLEPELRAQAAAISCPADVLMPGDVPHELALAAIARADIFLRTTLYDGDSISVREALHFGTPVIASDNGMRPSGVRLIPKEDLPALTDAIRATAAAGRTTGDTGAVRDQNIGAVYELYREIRGADAAGRQT